MMSALCRCAFVLTLALVSVTAALAQATQIRVGVLKFGTVNWELDVMETHDLPEKEGFELTVVPLASKSAINVAVQGGAVDVIVTDWLWVSRQRADGRNYTFVPYSIAVGGLMVDPAARIAKLSDLRGKKLGVAGGPVDKSWLFLRAFVQKTSGQDLLDIVEPSFAAPPLLNELMLRGELPAVLNFWHYGARLRAAGMKQLLGIEDVLSELGVQGQLPVIGWVFSETWAREHSEVLQGFLRASFAAKRIMAESDEEWERLRPMIKASDDATLRALRDTYRAGIPGVFGQSEREAARRVFRILAEQGGEELVGSSKTLSAGTFWDGFSIEAARQ
ncbi:MAG: ABC transporter substrate-binding protein [Gammaproteobacteria bacterium]